MKRGKIRKIHSQLALPFSVTSDDAIKKIFETLEQKFGLSNGSKQKLLDLGSGTGNILIYSATHYNIKSVGIEININLIKLAKGRIKALKKKI
ncbi:MAG: SAM-dependent methyltransferase [Promethearchaeota archaeon]